MLGCVLSHLEIPGLVVRETYVLRTKTLLNTKIILKCLSGFFARQYCAQNFITFITKYPITKKTTSLSHLHNYCEEIQIRSRQAEFHRRDEDVTFKNRRGYRLSCRPEYDYDEWSLTCNSRYLIVRETDCKKQRAADLVVILRCSCRLLAHPPLYLSYSKTGFWKVTSSHPRVSTMREGKLTFWQ